MNAASATTGAITHGMSLAAARATAVFHWWPRLP